VRLEDVASPIKAAMFSSKIDPATPGLISSLVAQVLHGSCSITNESGTYRSMHLRFSA
jgi:hypothetical protein